MERIAASARSAATPAAPAAKPAAAGTCVSNKLSSSEVGIAERMGPLLSRPARAPGLSRRGGQARSAAHRNRTHVARQSEPGRPAVTIDQPGIWQNRNPSKEDTR
jgi:hypothetical protein